MRLNKYLRMLMATVAVALLFLLGLQIGLQKQNVYHMIKSVVGNNTGWVTPPTVESRGTAYHNISHTVSTTESFSIRGLQNNTDVWQKALQNFAKKDPDLFESLVSDIHQELRQEMIKDIFEPVEISFQAALFNFSKFRPEKFKSQKPVIPHIIHQIWDSHEIPDMFKKWIKTIVEKHPHWEYWFWTVADAECLLRKKYPKYLDIFQKYPQNIFRTDAFRYFVLYDYGGFYIDLDVEALKPLDFWTYAFPAVISWENYEHTYLSHRRQDPNIMTTVLASKPKHPFFKMLQEDLVTKASVRNVLEATGPFYLDRTYKKYLNSSYSKAEDATIMTIHPRYWLPKHDTYVKTRGGCNMEYQSLTRHGKVVCDELEKDNYPNTIKPDSFLNHFWVHVNTWKGATRSRMNQNVFNIKDVVPNVKLVSQLIHC